MFDRLSADAKCSWRRFGVVGGGLKLVESRFGGQFLVVVPDSSVGLKVSQT